MRKPQLCLAMSVSITLLAANLLPAVSKPVSPGIGQKSAGVGHNSATGQRIATVIPKITSPGSKITAAKFERARKGIANEQVMLWLKKDASVAGGLSMPAAALTIHPALPALIEAKPAVSTLEAKVHPTLVAMRDGAVATDATAAKDSSVRAVEPTAEVPVAEVPVVKAPVAASKQLLAQLTPDQVVVAQAEGGSATSPIPPVVSGTVDMEEFKSSNTIDLKVAQSRTFRLRNKIVRTSISDPAIAEPVVVAENELVLLGKAPGGATLVIWDDAGNSMAIDLKVSRDYSQLQSTLREIDPRIIVKAFNVGGSDRVILMGDVDHPESVIRAFTAANMFMDDRGMKILASNNRLIGPKIGEIGQSSKSGGGQQAGQLSQLSQVNKYVYFSNANNNVGKANVMVSEGGRVTSLVKVRKMPLIVLHCTFLEMNTAAVRELGVQLGVGFTNQTFGFGIGGSNTVGQANGAGPMISFQSSPGISGTTGSAFTAAQGNPFGTAGGQLPVASPAPFPPLSGTQFNPLFITIPPIKTPTFGSVAQPVTFNQQNVLQTSVNGTTATITPLTAIGQGFINSAPTLLGQTFLLGAPGGAVFNSTGLPNMFTASSNFNSGAASRWSVNPTLNGIITHSRSRVLAEPTLVTVSGERAAFLAGGEIPIPQATAAAGQTVSSIVFEPFGIRLNMIPVLRENGSISLEVSPEERILSEQLAISFGANGSIPGFTTRKTQTTVELKPGQELFLSGLVSANSGHELDKTPLIGEVPVLGALYRSKAFAKNESELVVAVRPEIILPGTPGQLKLPEEISKTEGPRDVNMLQVEPTIVDERYMTSGRAERHQNVGTVLPAGAPIPDSQ